MVKHGLRTVAKVLLRYGDECQRETWLEPLLDGDKPRRG